jgi:hypothetical protein
VSALHDEYRRRCRARNDIAGQMPVLYAWARCPGVRIIELGVGNPGRGEGYTGNSTAAFLAGIELGGGSRGGGLWSVDIADPPVPPAWRDLPFWHLLVADDTSEAAVKFCPDGADVLFIDTSHYYDHTLAELRLYVPKVMPGGVVLMHDTDNAADWPDVPVALDAYCAETGLDWYGHPGWPGLGVIEIPR